MYKHILITSLVFYYVNVEFVKANALDTDDTKEMLKPGLSGIAQSRMKTLDSVPTRLSDVPSETILGFTEKVIDTGYAAGNMAMNGVQKVNEVRKGVTYRIEGIFDNVPSSKKLPIVDDLPGLNF